MLQQANGIFNDKQLNLLKAADRDKNQFLKRQALIEQIKLKDKNQQPLLANETEILALLTQEMDQDNFFRLDRALESYQKIEKAALENRIRLENEHKREILQKSHKELTDAQKKRNAENQLKYALGGAVLAAWNKLNLSTENIDPEKVKNTIVNNQNFSEWSVTPRFINIFIQELKTTFEAENCLSKLLKDYVNMMTTVQNFISLKQIVT